MGYLISVIIPTWNRANEVVCAVNSVLQQTYQNFEIIIADDGSTDQTENIFRNHSDKRIKYLHLEHSGLPAVARNAALHETRGDWIAFLDSDDEWLPNKLEEQIRLAEITLCQAVCSNAWRIQNSQNRGAYLDDQVPEIIRFSKLVKVNFVICSSALIKRSLIDKALGFSEAKAMKAWEDYALWLRIASLTNFAYCSKPLVEYSDEPLLSIRKFSPNEKEQKKQVLLDYLKWAKSYNPHFYYIWLAKLEKIQNQYLRK